LRPQATLAEGDAMQFDSNAPHSYRRQGLAAASAIIAVSEDVLALTTAMQHGYGRLDVLVNNAGIMERVDLLDGSVR
jgi:NAD(P)-dependent dehydrogenase (short-subunit alcohol dehydrogenase family)